MRPISLAFGCVYAPESPLGRPIFGHCRPGRAVLESAGNSRHQEAIPSSPTGAPKVVVYPAGSTQSASRTEERRSGARHRIPSLIYIQLGPENGGIVVNLGRDGLAFQAAMPLNLEKNSRIDLRLRGSGLNAELAGEIVWLGASQKDAGICFRDVPEGVQREIAAWIEQEARAVGTPAPGDGRQSKPMTAIPGIGAAREKSAARSLSAALAMSRAMPAKSTDTNMSTPVLPGALETTAIQTGPVPASETISSSQPADTASIQPENNVQEHGAASATSPEQIQPWQPVYESAHVEAPGIENSLQSPPEPALVLPVSEANIQAPAEEQPQGSWEPKAENGIRKTEGSALEIPIEHPSVAGLDSAPPQQLPGNLLTDKCPPEGGRYTGRENAAPRAAHVRKRASGPRVSSRAAAAAEKWVPPVLLAAWRRGGRLSNLLVAGATGVCCVIFILILTLAGRHSGLGQSSGNTSVQQPQRPDASAAGAAAAPDPSPSAAVEPAKAPPVSPPLNPPRPKPQPPETSLLASFEHALLGNGFGSKARIDDDQIGVQVWASKRSGYYYCADSPFYNTMQPGSFMTQGDALQSGYQPRRDRYCD